jgi:hypothetical protein
MKRQGEKTMKHLNVLAAARRAAAHVLAFAAMAAAPQSATASGTVAPSAAAEDGVAVTRSKRWWLHVWCHSMQERAFVEWMHAATGSTAWMHTMSASQVNAAYAWWLVAVWNADDRPPG